MFALEGREFHGTLLIVEKEMEKDTFCKNQALRYTRKALNIFRSNNSVGAGVLTPFLK